MKPGSRKSSGQRRPSPRQIRDYLEVLQHEHHLAYNVELLSDDPQWIMLLGLHLRMVELEQLEAGMQELLR